MPQATQGWRAIAYGGTDTQEKEDTLGKIQGSQEARRAHYVSYPLGASSDSEILERAHLSPQGIDTTEDHPDTSVPLFSSISYETRSR
jgi:hypothetical protein